MTISEIAKMAGVSSAAVSRYLNGGSLSQEKKDIIKKVVDDTGYVPSEAARMLRTKRTNRIGVIVPKIDSGSVPRIISGIAEVLVDNGYNYFLADTRNDSMKELEYLEAFKSADMDGVILLGTIITAEHKKALDSLDIPVVVVGQQVNKCACVYHNDKAAAYEMTKLLIKDGCEKLGMIGVMEEDIAAGLNRKQGFIEAVTEAGIGLEELTFAKSGFSVDDGKAAVEELLALNPYIDGLFCATDMIGLGALAKLREMNINVPEQIKVTAVGNHMATEMVTPSLTTAHYYYKTSGKEAATMLLDMLKTNNANKQKQVMLGFEVCQRQSS